MPPFTAAANVAIVLENLSGEKLLPERFRIVEFSGGRTVATQFSETGDIIGCSFAIANRQMRPRFCFIPARYADGPLELVKLISGRIADAIEWLKAPPFDRRSKLRAVRLGLRSRTQ